MCAHFDKLHDVTPGASGCEECLKMGSRWVHLRLCLTCGHVGCCDDSENRHASKHFRATHHAVMQSFEPDETWGWCYIHHEMSELERKRIAP
jgi:hypothetical protein